MAKEVRNLVEDKSAAKNFLANVTAVKQERKMRNIRAMIVGSCNPDKEEVDFIQTNIGDTVPEKKDQKQELKMQAQHLKEIRNQIAK